MSSTLNQRFTPVQPIPSLEAMAKRTWYESYEGMKIYHSREDYSRGWDLKYHVEMAFRESKSTEGLMKYLKWLGIEPVVTGNTVKFIDHKNMAVIDASAAYCPPLEFASIGHLI